MRKIVSLIFIAIPLIGFSQNIQKIQKQIDSLKNVRENYKQEIQSIENKIKELEKNKASLQFENIESIDFVINKKLRIRATDNSSGAIIAEPRTGEKLKLIDFNKDSGYWVVAINDKIGYVNEVFLTGNPVLEEFKLNIINKKTQSENEEKAKIAEKLKQSTEGKKQRLIKDYGASNAERILHHEFWIGMSNSMARESLGEPENINRSVGSWGTHEQWIFRKRNLYLYFENGILTSFQNEIR